MTLPTRLYTMFFGQKVGEDQFGNAYYRSSRRRSGGREERWVMYSGEIEASKVPAEWHAWLHHTTDKPIDSPKNSWQKIHLSNKTGTISSYKPTGNEGESDNLESSFDYIPWRCFRNWEICNVYIFSR